MLDKETGGESSRLAQVSRALESQVSRQVMQSFLKLDTDAERLALLWKQPVLHEILKIEPQFEGKSNARAAKHREAGNKFFQQHLHFKALEEYNKCVLNAESETLAAAGDAVNELSLAYANRSAALYHLKKFITAIRDVDSALERGYPSKMLYKIHERKARCLRMLGRHREAVASLRAALSTLQYSQLPEDKRQLWRAGIEQDMAALCINPELCDTLGPSSNNNGLTSVLESEIREAVDNSLTKLTVKSDEISNNNVREVVNNESIASTSLPTTFHQQHSQLDNGSSYNIQQTLLRGNNCSTESKSSVSMATRPAWNIPKLYGQNHDFYHSISNAVDVKYDFTKGRHLVANRDIRPGHVLLVEKPYASVVFEDFYTRRCYACFQRTAAPEPCLQCSTVCYCSAICRETAWHDYHRYECRYMAMYKRDWCGRMGHLAARVAMVTGVETMLRESIDNDVIIHSNKITEHKVSSTKHHQKEAGFNDEGIYANDYTAVLSLVTNSGRHSNAHCLQLAVLAASLVKMLAARQFIPEDASEETWISVGACIMHYLQSVQCNAYVIQDVQNPESFDSLKLSDIGIGLYSAASLINHSCDPNLDATNYGDVMVLRATRHIRDGEETTVSYGPLYYKEPLSRRQDTLLSIFLFTCQCEACLGKWPVFDQMSRHQPTLRCHHCHSPLHPPSNKVKGNMLVACSSCGVENDVADVLSKLGVSHESYARAMQKAIQGEGREAVNQLAEHMELMQRYLCSPWPDLISCQAAICNCYRQMAHLECPPD